jgi:hypothetical protein
MAVPRGFLALVAEIEAWNTKYGAGAMSPYASESFGGYSYSKGATAGGSNATTWSDAFASRLNAWRKI